LTASEKTFSSKVSNNSFDVARFVGVRNDEDVIVKLDNVGSEEVKGNSDDGMEVTFIVTESSLNVNEGQWRITCK
jgi:hypothetical protein